MSRRRTTSDKKYKKKRAYYLGRKPKLTDDEKRWLLAYQRELAVGETTAEPATVPGQLPLPDVPTDEPPSIDVPPIPGEDDAAPPPPEGGEPSPTPPRAEPTSAGPSAEQTAQAEALAALFVGYIRQCNDELRRFEGAFVLPDVVLDKLVAPCAKTLALRHASNVEFGELEMSLVVAGAAAVGPVQLFYRRRKAAAGAHDAGDIRATPPTVEPSPMGASSVARRDSDGGGPRRNVLPMAGFKDS